MISVFSVLAACAATAGVQPDFIETRIWEAGDHGFVCGDAFRAPAGPHGAAFDDPRAREVERLRAEFAAKDRVRVGAGPLRGPAGFDIQYDLSPDVADDPEFVDALIEAAEIWEAAISDPVTVVVEVDFTTGAGFLGATSNEQDLVDYIDFGMALVNDASAEEEPLTNLLPASLALAGNAGNITTSDPDFEGVLVTSANASALGIPDGTPTFDAFIVFNADFTFDNDPSDGIEPGQIDTVYIMVHEIGHMLGFVSAAGGGASGEIATTLDVFRFGIDDASNNPVTEENWRFFPREVRFGVEAGLDTVGAVPGVPADGAGRRFSTAEDGRQASHWKDDVILQQEDYIGVMDPTYEGFKGPRGGFVEGYLTQADRLAFSLIGWDVRIVLLACAEDLTGDGKVDADDLGAVIAAWGTDDAAADFTGDGNVDADDLGVLIAAWGFCD